MVEYALSELFKQDSVDKQIDISFDGFKVISKKEFVGSSHDKITKLILRVV
jgi:hypothetical protein